MATKTKIGRPATGHSPVVSIRLPEHMVSRIEEIAKYNKVAAAKIYREALSTGLRYMQREPLSQWEQTLLPRPKHHAEMREAGHAVAVFLQADALRRDPHECVYDVRLRRRGGGYMRPALHLPPKIDLRVTVAGAVAEAIDERRPFSELWEGHGCSGDRKVVERILREHKRLSVKRAADWVFERFEDPSVWDALDTLARRLIMNGSVSGNECYEIFAMRMAAITARAMRVSEKYFGPVDE